MLLFSLKVAEQGDMLLAEPLGHLPMHAVADSVTRVTELDEQSPENVAPFPCVASILELFHLFSTGFSTCFCLFVLTYLKIQCHYSILFYCIFIFSSTIGSCRSSGATSWSASCAARRGGCAAAGAFCPRRPLSSAR